MIGDVTARKMGCRIIAWKSIFCRKYTPWISPSVTLCKMGGIGSLHGNQVFVANTLHEHLPLVFSLIHTFMIDFSCTRGGIGR